MSSTEIRHIDHLPLGGGSSAGRTPAKASVAPLYEPARIPPGSPAKVDPPPGEDLITVNFGPNHPSTHGVLRLIVTLDGEVVVGLDADIGYVHTGIEKNMEQKSYWKAITYTPRIDYLSFFNNELAYVHAVEKLIAIDVPERAQWIRTLFAELNRLHSHLIFLGTSGLELGAMSIFFYCTRERESVLDLFEMVTGVRMHDRYPQIGGVAEDLPKGFYRECLRFCRDMPGHIDEYIDLLAGNPIWKDRLQGIGVIDADTAIAMGLTGPNLRASGVPYDLRRNDPYLAYGAMDFDVITAERGDCYDRFIVRAKEMYESVRIIEQCLEGMPTGAYISDDRKYVLPPRAELHTSMESLIHHFKLVTEGFRVAPGQVYAAVESARGELGCYLSSDGGPRPWRVRFRAPSFVALQSTAMLAVNRYIADLIAVIGSLDGVMGEVDR
jgi:NADH-quinone oxidoreductase subunit D